VCATCRVKSLARHWRELLGSEAERAHLPRSNISPSRLHHASLAALDAIFEDASQCEVGQRVAQLSAQMH
jgi:hypothetical protein